MPPLARAGPPLKILCAASLHIGFRIGFRSTGFRIAVVRRAVLRTVLGIQAVLHIRFRTG